MMNVCWGIAHLELVPYSLRRGSATHRYVSRCDLGAIRLQVRWDNLCTARIYIADAALYIARLAIDDAAAATLQQYTSFIAAFLIRRGA